VTTTKTMNGATRADEDDEDDEGRRRGDEDGNVDDEIRATFGDRSPSVPVAEHGAAVRSRGDARPLIRALGARPHPEGGWFREVSGAPSASSARALPGTVPAASARSRPSILYLLARASARASTACAPTSCGATMRAAPCTSTCSARARAHASWWAGDTPQACVPHGTWFAAEPAPARRSRSWAARASPGFEYEDFELAERERLLVRVPAQRELGAALHARHGGER
jgi:predicted cupin superfamily sugar epimerase